MDSITSDTDTRDGAPPDEVEDRPGLGDSPRRRLGLSAFIVITLFAIGVSVMPASMLKNSLLTVAQPYLGVTGLDQSWGVFAPEPPRRTGTILTVIQRADGTSVTLPQFGADGLDEIWDYRRRTFVSQLGGPNREADRAAYARWVADQDRAAGHEPVRVTLVWRNVALAPPGPGPDESPWGRAVIFTLAVAR